MNGAESLIRTAVAAGVGVCFANPGTTEMPIVAALDSAPGMRAVLALFEGVCTGAADGYARMAGKPAMTLLHLGPGLANGLANLHNARRANSPIVNVVGDHATWHAAADAPLASDIVSLASPMSGWVRACKSARALAGDMADAVAASLTPPGMVATLIVPSDCQWDPAAGAAPARVPVRRAAVAGNTIESVAEILGRKRPLTILLGGDALGEKGLRAAARVAAASGCKLMTETFTARIERGAGIPSPARLPYFPEQAIEALAGNETIVLAGAKDPVAFFGYQGVPSRLAPEGCRVELLARPEEDIAAALEDLARVIGAPAAVAVAPAKRPAVPGGKLDPATLGAALAALQPEHAIVVDESATSGGPYGAMAAGALPHSCLALTGGAIGQGFPTATGAAVACPERRVIALQADGSGMYTVQALWTQAREQLNVTTIVCSNRAYRILQIEAARAGNTEPGRQARMLTELAAPEIRWTELARGLGVPGVRVETADDLVRHLSRALGEPGPSLIEAML
ncbi:MAG TPA: acetolactate synthase large subunit [Candidatus Binataceae bacterium]|nr:acetolactate synthase large subunit [Candidatus Binataceae bacterium]